MFKLIACVLIGWVVALAQGVDPKLQGHAIWKQYQQLSEADKKSSCDTANRSDGLTIFCDFLADLLSPKSSPVAFAYYVVNKENPNNRLSESGILSFLASVAESRLDTQNAASTGSSGTTSVAERSGISDVLSAALESGAVTQTVNGSSLTLQGNALSLYRFVGHQDVFQYCSYDQPDCEGPFQTFLNKLSGSATLSLSNASTNTATGMVANPTTGTQTSAAALIQGSASHLTGFTVRFQPINKLDLRSKTYLDAWKTAFSDPSLVTAAQNELKTFNFTWFAIGGQPDHEWILTAMSNLFGLVTKSSSEKDFQSALGKAVTDEWDKRIPAWKTGGMKVEDLQAFVKAVSAYLQTRDAAINAVRQKQATGLTFEYAFARPANQPQTSTARLIYTFHPGILAADTATPAAGATKTTTTVTKTNDSAITLNFAAEMYDSPPPGTGALRDLQGALQLDRHFGTAIATLAAYYQYQNQPAALQIGAGNLAPGTNIQLNGTAATLLAPKGNIVVAQAMVTFALKSGTKLPLGVTWSNRTELIKGNELRGHVGFNFDWSSLLLSGQSKAASTQP
jgi:hypothetical protein